MLHIHKRLREIFWCSESIPFSIKAVIFVDDLLQLPPVNTPDIFSEYSDHETVELALATVFFLCIVLLYLANKL